MSAISSCADGEDDGDDSSSVSTEQSNTSDDVPAMDLNGRTISFLTFEEIHADMLHCYDEVTDDAVNYAKYRTILALEERFHCDIEEHIETEEYVNKIYRTQLASGADDFDIVFLYDRFAHYFAEDGLLYDYDSLGYVNLEKEYWDQSLLEYTTVGDKVYYAFGTLDFTYYDTTHCLVFNKGMATELGLGDLYSAVTSGEWTMDKMFEMCTVATIDEGDGEMTSADKYGYISSGKQILPNFWISSGTTTVKLDKDNLPYATIIGNERLSNVMDKCFNAFWDNQTWYVSTSMANQSDLHYEMFAGNKALFADYTFYYLNQLRDCEFDFGILPYPKFDSNQDEYYSRVEAGTTIACVPVTNPEPDIAGAIMEAMASTGYELILPEYYDRTLTSRNVRDEESAGMLDLIFKTRVYDLGDTWFCDQIRDGLMATMWNANRNTLASTSKRYENVINYGISDTVEAYSKPN